MGACIVRGASVLKYDILIKSGHIVDGTGNPSTVMDVGIANGKVRGMGRSLSGDAGKVIDATGAVVCLGFIDLHNHTDLAALAYPRCESHIMQGITTSVVGNCGLAMAPINPEKLMLLQEYLAPFLPKGFDWGWNWRSAEEYWARIESQGSSMNMVAFFATLLRASPIRNPTRGPRKNPNTPRNLNTASNLTRGPRTTLSPNPFK